jgi:RNA polymerase sigma-70 factor (ECF subfamily)
MAIVELSVQSFIDLLHGHLHSLRLIAFSILHDEDDVEEAVQETILKAFTHREQLRSVESFRPWLFQIVVNEARHRLRIRRDRNQRMLPLDEGVHEKDFVPREFLDWRSLPSLALEREEVHRALFAALNSIPVSYREVFLLRDVDHLSATETGKILGLSEVAVNTRLHRARLQMREILTPFFARPTANWTPAVYLTMMADMGRRFVQRAISCKKAVRELSSYIDGCLPPRLEEQLVKHLRLCQRCTIVLDTTRKLLYLAGDGKVFSVPFKCKQNVEQLFIQLAKTPTSAASKKMAAS